MAPGFQLAIAGNIGVGKSGLCLELARRLDARAELEDVGANPYFESFYVDPRRWAFTSQLAFAAESSGRHIRAQDGKAVVLDRTLYEGVEVFGRLLASRGDLQEEQLKVLERIAGGIRALPHQPTLLLYLTAPPAVLLERIAARARAAEAEVDAAYLSALDSLYGDFIAEWDVCPVLTVDTTGCDLRRAGEIDRLAERIKKL